MSTIRKLTLAFVLFVTIVGCAPTPTPQAAPIPQPTQPALPPQIQIIQPEQRSITVLGKGEVKVTPDMVQFAVGINTEDRVITEAKLKNDKLIQKVMAVLTKYEIGEEDIKTNYLSISPIRNYPSYTVSGYSARYSMQVTVRDLTKFENVMIEILQAGATSISGLSFKISDVGKYEEETRTLALQAAKEKAVGMAKELGQEITVPLAIREGIAQKSYSSNYAGSYALMDVDFFSTSEILDMLDRNTDLAFGQLTITAVVTVEFGLK